MASRSGTSTELGLGTWIEDKNLDLAPRRVLLQYAGKAFHVNAVQRARASICIWGLGMLEEGPCKVAGWRRCQRQYPGWGAPCDGSTSATTWRFSSCRTASTASAGWLTAVPAAIAAVARTLRQLDLGDNEKLKIDQAGFDTLLALQALVCSMRTDVASWQLPSTGRWIAVDCNTSPSFTYQEMVPTELTQHFLPALTFTMHGIAVTPRTKS